MNNLSTSSWIGRRQPPHGDTWLTACDRREREKNRLSCTKFTTDSQEHALFSRPSTSEYCKHGCMSAECSMCVTNQWHRLLLCLPANKLLHISLVTFYWAHISNNIRIKIVAYILKCWNVSWNFMKYILLYIIMHCEFLIYAFTCIYSKIRSKYLNTTYDLCEIHYSLEKTDSFHIILWVLITSAYSHKNRPLSRYKHTNI